MSVAVAIRVDSGVQIGSGHVMRCLSLSSELERRGARVTFVCRDLTGNLTDLIEGEGYSVKRLPAPESAAGEGTRSSEGWLAVPWRQDCEETSRVLESIHAQWLIVDHYGIDAAWERVQRGWVERIMVIDDLADREHECDLLLDQNYFGAQTSTRYENLVPEYCRVRLGPRYALLRRDYPRLRATVIPRTGQARRAFVFFGGTDGTDETSKAIEAFNTPGLTEISLDIVVGANHPAPQKVAELVARRPGTMLHANLPTLSGLMLRADIGVGAGGTTTWERLCLRLPSVVTTVAANQEAPIASLAAERAVLWVGRAPNVSALDLSAAIAEAINRPPYASLLIDGWGAARIAGAIVPPSPAGLSLRALQIGDAELLFDWRNEPDVREMSFDSDPISWQAHLKWFMAKLEDSDTEVFIGEVDGLPIGQVRLSYRQGEAEVSYSIDLDFRGLGFGTALLRLAVGTVSRGLPLGLRASVKSRNSASRSVFLRLGWHETIKDEEVVFRSQVAVAAESRNRGEQT